MNLVRYFCLSFLFCYNLSSAQVIDGVALAESCDLQVFYTSKDTIKATGNYTCNALSIDTTIDATWLLYAKSDTTFLFYQVSIKNHKKNGKEIRYAGKGCGFYEYKSYSNGKLHGISMQLGSNGINSVENYIDGKHVGVSYFSVDCTDVKEETFYHCIEKEEYVFFNKKGKRKKTIKLFSK
jgi:hypothetical protein